VGPGHPSPSATAGSTHRDQSSVALDAGCAAIDGGSRDIRASDAVRGVRQHGPHCLDCFPLSAAPKDSGKGGTHLMRFALGESRGPRPPLRVAGLPRTPGRRFLRLAAFGIGLENTTTSRSCTALTAHARHHLHDRARGRLSRDRQHQCSCSGTADGRSRSILGEPVCPFPTLIHCSITARPVPRPPFRRSR
jgi:hypothetical protein